jgi:hypothetical protein
MPAPTFGSMMTVPVIEFPNSTVWGLSTLAALHTPRASRFGLCNGLPVPQDRLHGPFRYQGSRKPPPMAPRPQEGLWPTRQTIFLGVVARRQSSAQNF